MSVKKLYRAWLARAQRSGLKLTDYRCPNCQKAIKAVVPPKGQQFDSLVTCPHCGTAHFKVVYDDGHVNARLVAQLARRVGRAHATRARKVRQHG